MKNVGENCIKHRRESICNVIRNMIKFLKKCYTFDIYYKINTFATNDDNARPNQVKIPTTDLNFETC